MENKLVLSIDLKWQSPAWTMLLTNEKWQSPAWTMLLTNEKWYLKFQYSQGWKNNCPNSFLISYRVTTVVPLLPHLFVLVKSTLAMKVQITSYE